MTCLSCSSRCAEVVGRACAHALNSPCAARAWHGRGLVCYARSSEGKEASSWQNSRYQAHNPICPPYDSTGANMADFQVLTTRAEGAVLFAVIDSPPINLIGPALVADLVSLIELLDQG